MLFVLLKTNPNDIRTLWSNATCNLYKSELRQSTEVVGGPCQRESLHAEISEQAHDMARLAQKTLAPMKVSLTSYIKLTLSLPTS